MIRPSMSELAKALGDPILTTEEYFSFADASNVDEARAMLDSFRQHRAEVEGLVRLLRETADERIHIGTKMRFHLINAAQMIETQENNIAFLRGQLAGLQSKYDALERTKDGR